MLQRYAAGPTLADFEIHQSTTNQSQKPRAASLLPFRFTGPAQIHRLRRIARALKRRPYQNVPAHAEVVAIGNHVRRKVYLVIPVVGGVLHRKQATMEIKEGNLAGKGKYRTGSSDDADLARQTAVGAGSGKAYVHQSPRLHVFEGSGRLAVVDTRFRIDGKTHGNGIERVTQRELVVLGIHGNDLAVGIGGGRRHADAYVAGKDIVFVVVELSVNVNALAFFERKLRGLRAVVEDVGALVKINAPVAAAENVHGHAVAQAIDAADGASDRGGSGARHRRGVKYGIVAVSDQRARGGGAIKDVCFGIGLRDRCGRWRGLRSDVLVGGGLVW